jgi:hypothetical protein
MNSNGEYREIEIVTPSFEELKSHFQRLPEEQQKAFVRELIGQDTTPGLTIMVNGNVSRSDTTIQLNSVPAEMIDKILEAIAQRIRTDQ